MPIPLNDPFYIANNATFAALKVNRLLYDLTFLRAYYADSGSLLNDCEIATATYLAWHESLKRSGVRFEEHVSKLGLPNCKMDQLLVNLLVTQKEEGLRARIAYAREEEKNSKIWLTSGLGVGILGVGIAFVLHRRRFRITQVKAEQHSENSV